MDAIIGKMLLQRVIEGLKLDHLIISQDNDQANLKPHRGIQPKLALELRLSASKAFRALSMILDAYEAPEAINGSKR